MKAELIDELKKDVVNLLSSHPTTTAYKIGKTSDIIRRFREYSLEGFQYLFPIATGSTEIIDEAEKELIEIFKNDDLCVNAQAGGGDPGANLLYLAIKCNIKNIDDLNDDDVYEPRQIVD